MIQIGALFKLLEQPDRYLPIDAPASFARPVYRELTLRGFDVRLEIGCRIYELPDITLHNLRVGESTITLRFWKESKETRHEVLALEGDLLVHRRSSRRNLPNERAQLTYNGRFQDHRERGLASGLV